LSYFSAKILFYFCGTSQNEIFGFAKRISDEKTIGQTRNSMQRMDKIVNINKEKT
jgi:hypothetical protein